MSPRLSPRHVALGALRPLAVALALTLALAPMRAASADEAVRLSTIERQVAKRFTAIPHLAPETLAADLGVSAAADDIVLVDVREEEEFAVSRLPGAIRVEPGLVSRWSPGAWVESVKGKKVVFYCSVGVRSSQLAEALADDLKARGATGVYNLSGGIFGWHNRELPLRDDAGETEWVHPYDESWGRYLMHRDRIGYEPRPH